MKPVLSSARVRDALFRLLRAAFRALPVGESTRDALRQRFLQRFPSVRPIQPKGIAASGVERRPRVHAAERAIGYVERRDEPLPVPLPATLVAFYLPQFHTIPENDEWWGKGFTEWRNVTRALPQFEGHMQPRLPGDLGFYDLRNPQVMRDQAELAKAYGISAFCFYFYWFGGKTLLEDPLKQWLADRSIDLQFCLCWANENWTRRWDGREGETLIAQTHSPADDLAFIAHIEPYLRDPRYLRVEGKPLLLLYRPGLLPEVARTADRWRAWCRENGVGEIVLAYVQSFERPDPSVIGFDAAAAFPPNLGTTENVTPRQTLLNPHYDGEVMDWRAMAAGFRNTGRARFPVFPGVNCGWDNEPRRPGRGRTYLYASPRQYGEWLEDSIRSAGNALTSNGGRLVFINAWNEWAEGAVLEPDSRLGYAWLEATREALARAARIATSKEARPCVVVHAWYPAVLPEILDTLKRLGRPYRLIVTTGVDRVDAVRDALAAHGVEADVEPVENRGRDILPFLRVAERLAAEGEEVVLKLHTKHSPHRSDGERWRRELLSGLLPEQGSDRILQAFAEDPSLGMVAPEGHVLPLSYYWGSNEANVRHLATRTGIPEPDLRTDCFASGSMFWVRLRGLRPLLDAHLAERDFEPEAAQIDGTLAHAVERVFALSVRSQGLRVATAAMLHDPVLPKADPASYRYAGHS